MGKRVVIYARGMELDIEAQIEHCRATAERLGWQVVGLAVDSPDTTTGWAAANAMVDGGEADNILVQSRLVVPSLIESVTGALRGRRPHRLRPSD